MCSVSCGGGGGRLHHAADGEEQPHASGGDEGAPEAASGGAQGPHRQRPGAVRDHVHDALRPGPQLGAVAPGPEKLPRLPGQLDQREGEVLLFTTVPRCDSLSRNQPRLPTGAASRGVCQHQKGNNSLHGRAGAAAGEQLRNGRDVRGRGGLLSV